MFPLTAQCPDCQLRRDLYKYCISTGREHATQPDFCSECHFDKNIAAFCATTGCRHNEQEISNTSSNVEATENSMRPRKKSAKVTKPGGRYRCVPYSLVAIAVFLVFILPACIGRY